MNTPSEPSDENLLERFPRTAETTRSEYILIDPQVALINVVDSLKKLKSRRREEEIKDLPQQPKTHAIAIAKILHDFKLSMEAHPLFDFKEVSPDHLVLIMDSINECLATLKIYPPEQWVSPYNLTSDTGNNSIIVGGSGVQQSASGKGKDLHVSNELQGYYPLWTKEILELLGHMTTETDVRANGGVTTPERRALNRFMNLKPENNSMAMSLNITINELVDIAFDGSPRDLKKDAYLILERIILGDALTSRGIIGPKQGFWTRMDKADNFKGIILNLLAKLGSLAQSGINRESLLEELIEGVIVNNSDYLINLMNESNFIVLGKAIYDHFMELKKPNTEDKDQVAFVRSCLENKRFLNVLTNKFEGKDKDNK